ncbi:alpha/beta hydrolase family protein [Nonomuraea gerenzanensis]|uniref:Lipase (Secreted protein) n=1 Tax=Nonomuraea gerenzanensis TaxID=93944 RepID=A0A1M4EMA9_9ACTN|nr:alpha/beta hydrolase [Nonomuraea gerenzanensis]UBU11493.1 alpha/beta hydrolase [Nonomuraea gerenzanensis]SBO99980.1 lipase (secreted protein) [Nonomuraea gerenzanensis]
MSHLIAVTGLVAVMAATSLGPASSSASASAAAELHLPKPTGSRPVGTTSLHLKDTSRPDPWVPGVKARELMVSLWYPAKAPGRHRAQYMTPKESELLLKDGGITGIPADTLSKVRTHAFTDARPAGRARSLPLVVLSPGHSKPRSELTGLAEELASRGYVVAAVDHTYENVAQTFPDGRVTTCVTCEMKKDPDVWKKLEQGRAADVSFVLDELTGAHPKWKHARLIDPARIAMSGQSAGGASTLAAMAADSRLRAGIDVDGTVETPLPEAGLSRPFLLLGKPATYTPGRPGTGANWEGVWAGLHGWKRWLLVTGAVHLSFTDLGVLVDQLGIEDGAEIPGARAMAITRRYVVAFFDQHLRKKPQPLLDKPSASYPEVEFCAPEKKTCA